MQYCIQAPQETKNDRFTVTDAKFGNDHVTTWPRIASKSLDSSFIRDKRLLMQYCQPRQGASCRLLSTYWQREEPTGGHVMQPRSKFRCKN